MNDTPKSFNRAQPVRLIDSRTSLNQTFGSFRAAATFLGTEYLPALFPKIDRKRLFIDLKILQCMADWKTTFTGGPLANMQVIRTTWAESIANGADPSLSEV